MTVAHPRLNMEAVEKSFGPVRALSSVDLKVEANEVHGLLGGNGAGKTTLMNVLYGLYRAEGGTIKIDGATVVIDSPRAALEAGVGMVHQTFLQIDTYTVLENIVLGTSETGSAFSMDLSDARSRVVELSEHFGLSVDPDVVVEDLPVGVRQRVEILKALYRGSKILILDEPTTNLTPQEVDDLFDSIRTMVDEGMSVILITHKIRETMGVCDRMTVMRNGRNVVTVDKSETDAEQLASLMVGESVDTRESDVEAVIGLQDAVVAPEKLPVEVSSPGSGLAASGLVINNDHGVRLLDGFDLTVPEGQILGVAGVAGNGQVELAEALSGVRPIEEGTVTLGGTELAGQATAKWLSAFVAYVPEDRHRDGILPTSSITENLLLGSHRDADVKKFGLIDWGQARQRAADVIERFSVRASGPQAMAGDLSGGNIQRVILARAFAHQPKLLVLHNPTRGLDMGSTQFVYEQVRAAASKGCVVLLLSEDLDEVIALSDRIVALYAGRQTGAWSSAAADPYDIGRSMTGLAQT
ncbi:ABC transporter ATP-binding protein [Janibacter cremeus]|uniref:Simple sugar transport system ATP-binding protein n=1 Tax=Janibacter cremeus TaxID=1285192 RepID=A0A852VLH6_9MICO|nr:ABC transporter ATP-binding protein [Janibacter cremeus]NYF97927.1 simple sugar transport system ATP-binding protein [Janibacter cremeus]